MATTTNVMAPVTEPQSSPGALCHERPQEHGFEERRRPDSNRGMRVLQTLALPLGDGACTAAL